jgi:hypothetical protein
MAWMPAYIAVPNLLSKISRWGRGGGGRGTNEIELSNGPVPPGFSSNHYVVFTSSQH